MLKNKAAKEVVAVYRLYFAHNNFKEIVKRLSEFKHESLSPGTKLIKKCANKNGWNSK